MGKGAKVVIDANVFISAFGWGGNPLKVIKLLANGKIKNCASEEILEELSTTIAYGKLGFPKSLQVKIMEFVLAHSEIVSPRRRINIVSDSEDDKFLECAATAGARFIITGDKALLAVQEFDRIKIVTPEAFLNLGGN